MVGKLSRFKPNEEVETEVVQINEECPDDRLLDVRADPWFADMTYYLAKKIVPPGMTYQQKKRLFYGLR